MARKCEQCKSKISDLDFLCPHCGAILGEGTKKTSAPRREKKKFVIPSGIFAWIGSICMVAALFFGVWMLLDRTSGFESDGMTQTTAPLAVYELQIKNSTNRSMEGVMIDVYRGDELVYSCLSGDYGKASFVLPELDGYYVKLSNLSVPYCYIYQETQFFFPEGQRQLQLVLRQEKVPYTITVVNDAGEPVPGVAFSSDGITDEQGKYTFYALYDQEVVSTRIWYVPTGYLSTSQIVRFPGDSFEMEVVLQRLENVELADDQQIYTLKTIDEYGDPLVGQEINIIENAPGLSNTYRFTTNTDGLVTFIGARKTQYIAHIPGNPDYYGVYFPYEEGSIHQTIQLEVHKTEYTYTINFEDQFGEGVPGVRVIVSDNSVVQEYTSDSDGVITFVSSEYEPAGVAFQIVSVPENYRLAHEEILGTYSFYGGRSKTIELLNLGEVEYNVTVLDEYGDPIAGAELKIWVDQSTTFIYVKTDENGQCKVMLPYGYNAISEVFLPEGYKHLTFAYVHLSDAQREITMKPYHDDMVVD